MKILLSIAIVLCFAYENQNQKVPIVEISYWEWWEGAEIRGDSLTIKKLIIEFYKNLPPDKQKLEWFAYRDDSKTWAFIDFPSPAFQYKAFFDSIYKKIPGCRIIYPKD